MSATEESSGSRFRHEIASDVSISGRINFPADARIDGKLKGEIRADALLVIGQGAHLEATIRARRLIVYGTLRGDVRQSGSVEIQPGARLIGNVEARSLIVHTGARFEGFGTIGTTATQSTRHSRRA